MNFKFEGVESGDPLRIGPGVSEVTIIKVEEGTMPYGNNIPSLDVTFQDSTKATYTEKFSMDTEIPEGKEESSEDRSLRRIKHIGTKIVTEDIFNGIKNTTQLSAILVGQKVRIKFAAREYEKDGEIKVATQLPNFFFAESIATTPSKLKYDPSNKLDYRKVLGVSPSANGVEEGTVLNDTLPF